MFGGSGGFTTGYINYLNDKYNNNINWKDNINKIYHFDMNDDVVKSAGLEFFCLTGVLPNMEDNLKYKNSFTDEFNNKKFMNIITNPPYGGDKTSQSNAQLKQKKIKEYINTELLTLKDELQIKKRKMQIKKIEEHEKKDKKDSDKTKVSVKMCSQRINKYAKQHNLTGNDKESSSLILIMDMLDVNGTAIGVLKEGVFFNKTYKDIRKCLVENFNVREIISVPQDQFENTSTKTSIVIFDNTKEKTTKVKFFDLVVEKYTEDKFEDIKGEIILSENKGDICGISDKLISIASKDEILKNKTFSLNSKDYKLNNIVVSDDYTLNNLDDTCDIILGTRITKKENIEGDMPVYGGGDITFYTNKSNRNENTLIISRYALSKTCVRLIPNKFFLNDSGLSITSKNKELQKYINYYLLSDNNQEYIYKNCTSGSIQKNLNMSIFHKLKIPIPKSPEKNKYWVDKISTPYNEKNEKQTKIKELEAFIQKRIKEMGENEDCDEVKLGSICKLLPGTKHCTNISKENGNYKFYNSSQYSNLYVDFCEINEYSIIIGQGGVISIHYDINFTPSKHVCVLQINNKNYLHLEYIYYYLINQLFNFKTNGSTIQWLNKTNIKLMQIKIPKNKQLIQDLEPTFKEIDTLQNDVKTTETLYKSLIEELSEEAIPKDKQIKILPEPDNETNELSDETDENIIN